MIDLLVRVVGSAVIGWALGGAAGTVVSRTFTSGGAQPLVIVLIPLTMIIVFLASYALVPRPR